MNYLFKIRGSLNLLLGGKIIYFLIKFGYQFVNINVELYWLKYWKRR